MRKLVVKIGSSTLADADGRPDYAFLARFAGQIAQVKDAGWQPIIVTSGAIVCGLEALDIPTRPSDMPSLQAAASVGQSILAGEYASALAPFGIMTGSVLLTRRDTADRTAYLHARDTLKRLLDLGVVPIVNENDTVSIEQIRFGDNDTLAALVACLVDADLVIILSDIDGLYDANPRENASAKLIERVDSITPAIMASAGGTGTVMGSGGMVTKLKAARVLMSAGIPMVVCYGREDDVLPRIASGESVGTYFAPGASRHEITPKKLWIALGDSAKGSVTVDDGAVRALVRQGSSLLTVGVKAVDGRFDVDDIVDVKDARGYIIARGKIAASNDELALACGMDSRELADNRVLAHLATRPLMHRDDLIVFD